MKKVILSIGFALLGISAMAQSSNSNNSNASAVSVSTSHNVTLNLKNVAEVRFNPAVAQQTTFEFDDADKLENGLTTDGIAAELQVRSNKNWSMSVKAATPEFAYVGDGVSGTDVIAMPASVLGVGVYASGQIQSENAQQEPLYYQLDGATNEPIPDLVNGGFLTTTTVTTAPVMEPVNNTNYQTLTTTDESFIANGTKGGFGNSGYPISYKAEPGLDYAAGSYTMEVVYTVTTN